MQPENEIRLAKIKKLSWFFRVICTLFMALCVLQVLFFMTGPIFRHGRDWGIGILWQGYNGVEFKVYSLTLHERVVAAISFALTMTFAFFCGLQLFRLLGFYSRGEIFTRASARQIRLWGFACVAWGIVRVGWLFLPLVLANSERHLGTRMDPGAIFTGLGIVAISWFMEMATEMREENELTV
jgi:hypothetical protein